MHTCFIFILFKNQHLTRAAFFTEILIPSFNIPTVMKVGIEALTEMIEGDKIFKVPEDEEKPDD